MRRKIARRTDVIAAAERGIQRIRHTHHLAFSFQRYCGLSLWRMTLSLELANILNPWGNG